MHLMGRLHCKYDFFGFVHYCAKKQAWTQFNAGTGFGTRLASRKAASLEAVAWPVQGCPEVRGSEQQAENTAAKQCQPMLYTTESPAAGSDRTCGSWRLLRGTVS